MCLTLAIENDIQVEFPSNLKISKANKVLLKIIKKEDVYDDLVVLSQNWHDKYSKVKARKDIWLFESLNNILTLKELNDFLEISSPFHLYCEHYKPTRKQLYDLISLTEGRQIEFIRAWLVMSDTKDGTTYEQHI